MAWAMSISTKPVPEALTPKEPGGLRPWLIHLGKPEMTIRYTDPSTHCGATRLASLRRSMLPGIGEHKLTENASIPPPPVRFAASGVGFPNGLVTTDVAASFCPAGRISTGVSPRHAE